MTVSAFTLCSVALFGLLSGSFLNVVIFRLPLMMQRQWDSDARHILGIEPPKEPQPAFNIMVPRSQCFSCHTPIRPWHNIPVISWLLLRGRCAFCQARISARYPLVECLTSIAFTTVVWHFGAGSIAWFGLLLTAALIALTFIDIDTQMLPDSITLPLIWLGLIFNWYTAFVPLERALLGAVTGYLSLWSIFWIFKLITGKDGMGFGDFKLLAALGAWMGVHMLPLIILLSSLIGIVAAVILQVKKSQAMAFGPALAIAGWLAFVGHESFAQLMKWWALSSGLTL